jgi:hypothetical protein
MDQRIELAKAIECCSAALNRQDAKFAKNRMREGALFTPAFSEPAVDGWSMAFNFAFLASLAVHFGR